MKTPDEIKKEQSLYTLEETKDILQQKGTIHSQEKLYRSAIAYIQQLEAENTRVVDEKDQILINFEQLEQERDALLKSVREDPHCCFHCKHNDGVGCKSNPCTDGSCFEWRGVKED